MTPVFFVEKNMEELIKKFADYELYNTSACDGMECLVCGKVPPSRKQRIDTVHRNSLNETYHVKCWVYEVEKDP